MNNTGLALLIGLLAGIAGGFVPKLIDTDAPDGSSETVTADDGGADITARLERIEAALERITEGRMTAGGEAALSGTAPMKIEIDDASMEKLQAATKKTVEETLAEIKAKEPASTLTLPEGTRIRRPSRKRMKLADAASDFGLSSGEEAELREIYQDTMDKAMKLIAGEDGDVEEIKRDIEAMRDDPTQRMALMGKYIPKFIPKIGEFMKLDADRRKRVNETLGKDRAREFNRKYDVEESNPFGIGGNMRFETEMNSPVVGR